MLSLAWHHSNRPWYHECRVIQLFLRGGYYRLIRLTILGKFLFMNESWFSWRHLKTFSHHRDAIFVFAWWGNVGMSESEENEFETKNRSFTIVGAKIRRKRWFTIGVENHKWQTRRINANLLQIFFLFSFPYANIKYLRKPTPCRLFCLMQSRLFVSFSYSSCALIETRKMSEQAFRH